MKKFTGLMVAGMVLAVLSGCTTYQKAESYVTQPVVKNVKKGMTKQQVHTIAGNPSTDITMAHARGTCETYVLGKGANNQLLTYFVSYTDAGRVMNYGFQSCAEYDTDPQVQSQTR